MKQTDLGIPLAVMGIAAHVNDVTRIHAKVEHLFSEVKRHWIREGALP
jgi:hypothetical protein